MDGSGGMEEALVMCSNKSLGIGITICDIESGKQLLHIPTCASPPYGLVSLIISNNSSCCCFPDQHYLVASQISKKGSIAGGAIFMWPLSKSPAPVHSYPMEVIGPITCTKNGLYLAGGAPAGNVYIWEILTGRMLRNWPGHHSTITCLTFSHDDSFLISSSEDGTIIIWPLISLLDETNFSNMPGMFNFSSEHTASITGIVTTSSRLNPIYISCSLDETCKVWDLVSGRVLQTWSFSVPITSIVLDPTDKCLFSGSVDGRIFMTKFNPHLVNDACMLSEETIVLSGHKGPITALTYSGLGLISASEDCTVCLWDVVNCVVLRRFNHSKGPVTNLVVIPQASLRPWVNRHRRSTEFRVPVLDKWRKAVDQTEGSLMTLPSCSFAKDHQPYPSDYTKILMQQNILDLEEDGSPEAIQMLAETRIESQAWAVSMTKQVMQMNKYLQSRLLDMMEYKLLQQQSPKKAKLPMVDDRDQHG